jgi:transposase-like protein
VAWSWIAGSVYRWVQRFLPLFQDAARVHRRPVGEKWRVDETYTRLGGTWTYIYRAIDKHGQVVDAYFSKRRNAAAAEGFFQQAMGETRVTPERVTTDKAKCYPPALRTLLPNAEHRRSRYLNNGLERDHGHLKQRLSPMRSFKSATAAAIFTRGHALIQNLRNGFSKAYCDRSASSTPHDRMATVNAGNLTRPAGQLLVSITLVDSCACRMPSQMQQNRQYSSDAVQPSCIPCELHRAYCQRYV